MEWVVLVVGLVLVGVGGFLAFQTVSLEVRLRRSFGKVEEDLRDDLKTTIKTTRADLASFSEQVEDLIERARAERLRADGRKGGRPRQDAPPEAPGPPQNGGVPWTRDTYLDHVRRTGKADPAIEAALGL